ncbi:MAG TPA: DUF2127 domain-containing protein [Candidatus Dormibacteraeota bacterium]|jgi:uncharacterized membrane protein (DUF2068 family)
MTGLARWCRWEFGRRIEINGVIVYIICERLVKAVVLIGGGIVLLLVASHTDLRNLAEQAQDQLDLNGGTSLWRRLFDQLLARFGGRANPIAAAAIVYGILEAVEAVGLILRRRWAEYLVLLATVAFLPLELDELVRAPSALKGLAVVVNIAVAIYLIWRKELFLARDRSSAEAA